MDISGKAIVERMCKLGEIKEYVLYCGIPSSTISNWKTRNNSPKVSDLVKIAEYKRVSLEWLLTGKESEGFECSKEEKELLSSLRLLDERDRQEILDLIEIKLNRTISRQAQDKTAVPSA